MPRADPEVGGAPLTAAVEDMGDIRGMDGGFYASSGKLTDALVPDVGDRGRLVLNVNIPVDQTGTVKVGFSFEAGVERGADGVTLQVKVGGGVTASQKAQLYFATLEAFAQAKVFGYVEAKGDSGTEAWRLLGGGIYGALLKFDEEIADALFNGDPLIDLAVDMDESDYYERGTGYELSAGVSASGAGMPGGGVGASFQQTAGERVSGYGQHGLRAEGRERTAVGIQGEHSPFALDGEVQATSIGGRLAEVGASVTGAASASVDELNVMLVGGRWVTGLLSTLSSLITGGAGIGDENASRAVGALAKYAAANGGVGVGVEVATKKALDQLKLTNDVKVGFALKAEVTWTPEGGYALEVRLDRTSSIEVGENSRALVHGLVEQMQQVFKLNL
ncbi:MAG: hypothetical protein V4850_35705 [Myxococcota bacterium]